MKFQDRLGLSSRSTRTAFLLSAVGLMGLAGVSVQAQSLRVQYRTSDTNASDNAIAPHLGIVNGGTTSIPLNELTVRYWYTVDGVRPQNYFCDWAQVGCATITGRFVTLASAVTGADNYLELGFTGGTLAAGAQTGPIQSRIAKDNWSNYNETGDHSYDPTKSAFADWNRVTLYRSGTLVWGTEPGGAVTPTPTAIATATARPTATPTGATPTPTSATPTATSRVTPTPTTTPGGTTTIQAETGTLGGGATVDTNNAGFNGTGFVNFPATGGFVQLASVNGGGGGAATLAIRFALGATGSRTGLLLVNGVSQNLTTASTGAWTTWNTLTLNVTLTAGATNTLRFQSSGQDLGNIDQVQITVGGTATPTPTNTATPRITATPTATPTPTGTVRPTATPTARATPRVTPTPVTGTHLDNPFVGGRGYVNVDWQASVQAEAASAGGTLGNQMLQVGNVSTAVWMDRIAAITAGRGLMGHLDAALAQGANMFTVVIYDLPNRDCAALASNGELLIAQDGLNRYKLEYVDPIADILDDPAYAGLRIIAIIEPDSLPNLITNVNTHPRCQEAQQTGAYVQGVQYAINKLHAIPNVYLYVDIAHSGWLGWDTNFGPAADLIGNAIKGATAGVNSVDGLITNTANYTPAGEPFLTDSNLSVGGVPVRQSTFYEFNPYFDELDFATAMRNAFLSRGFPSTFGMLIDTSRNGWGGAARPAAVSTSTVANTFVDQSRIDRRPHRGGWCNQSGAGIGARPQANPAAGIDAYIWIKPPGESDGVSSAGVIDPDDPSKGFDGMCNPNANSVYNAAFPTNALANAPHAGRWFPAQFRMLVQNAFPPIQ